MNIIERICAWFASIWVNICTGVAYLRTEWNKFNNSNSTNNNSGNSANTRRATTSIENGIDYFLDILDRLGRGIARNAMIGIALNVIVAYFYPELPKRIPIIFGWYDGCMQFSEFAVKFALGYIYAFFHGNGAEFFGESCVQFQAMLAQFGNWLSTIHF